MGGGIKSNQINLSLGMSKLMLSVDLPGMLVRTLD